jgi:hypothetical protein
MKLIDKILRKEVKIVPEDKAEIILKRFYGGRIHKKSVYTKSI